MQKPKDTKMMQEAESQRRVRRAYYLKALAIKKLVGLVPVEIQELPISSLALNQEAKTLLLTIWVWEHDKLNATDVIKTLKMAGVIGLTSKYCASIDTWYMGGGTLQLPQGYTMSVTLYGTEKPPECELKMTRKMEEVITYEAICKETGEKVAA